MTDDDFLVGSGPGAVRCRRLPATESGHRGNLVLLQGGAHTSACWLDTPDGRQGWAHRFASAGYDVHLVDWIDTGTAYDPFAQRPGDVIDSLAALVRRIGPTVVVGHSLGGGLAIKTMW